MVGGISLGILGAIAGTLVLGGEYLSGSRTRPHAGEYVGAAAVGAAAGGAIGVVVGGGVGAAFHRGNRRFP
jgi:hypothetical protein